MLKNFRSYNLAVEFYKTTRASRLPVGLKDQFNRASSSIALNLAEGYGKRTTKDRLKYFQIALGSIRECQAILDLETQAFTKPQIDNLDHLAAATFRLITQAPANPGHGPPPSGHNPGRHRRNSRRSKLTKIPAPSKSGTRPEARVSSEFDRFADSRIRIAGSRSRKISPPPRPIFFSNGSNLDRSVLTHPRPQA